MDYDQDNELEALEHILIDSSVEPIMLSYVLLRRITNDFSQEIGRGGFGVVYMGHLRNGKVAVKQLSQTDDIIEEKFKDELTCLIRVKHKNIVRLLGYCSDTQGKAEQYNGHPVLAEIRQRFLCFEYVPNKSLHDYLKDETNVPEWDERYQLIEGICKGVRYLHNEERINHLDLKPENILLDADMVPKITDFGLSRRFSREQSKLITKNIRGTPPYIAPEYWNRGEISSKSDIYSLGIIIIKLLRGSNESFDFEDWHKSLDTGCSRVKGCIRIAQLCLNYDPYQRPTIDYITDMLNEKETPVQMSPWLWQTGKLLEVDLHPLELHFPFERNKLIECPVTLTNRTDHHIGVRITLTSSDALNDYFHSPRSPFEMVEPHSTLVVVVTLRELLVPPSQDRSEFEVLLVAMGSEEHLKNLELDPSSNFVRRVEELGGQVHRRILTAVICEPTSHQAAVTYQNISTKEFGGAVYSLDVHPTETWILMGHGQQRVSIWNYLTKKCEKDWQVSKEPGMVYQSPHFSDRSAICSAKFIAQKQWFAAGDGYGWIYVYSYAVFAYTPNHNWVHRFKAHSRAPVTLMAVHPTCPFLLSASNKDNVIKLWDWDQRWVCTRKFLSHPSGVDSFRFNPRDINMFASVGIDGTAKVWNIDSSDPVNILPMANPCSVDFFSADSDQRRFLVTCNTRTKCTYIWDLQTKERVRSLGVSSRAIQDVAFHPALPILVTRLSDGTVCLWDVTTYRLMGMVHLTESPVRDLVFIGTKEITWLVVGCTEGIAIMEINFPAVRTSGGIGVRMCINELAKKNVLTTS